MELQKNIFLKEYNTFGVQAIANQFVEIQDERQLIELYNSGIFQNRFFVLGGGSNVLFTTDFEGTIIKISNKGIQHFIEGNNIYITAAGGEIWNDLVWYCVDHGFPGLENMALIPGTVGASPIQNIGAYGTELMDVMYTCRAFDTLTGEFKTFTNKECGFSYRDSIFKSKYKGRYIIVSVTYKLNLHSVRNTSYGAIESELAKRGINNPTMKDVAEVVSFIRVEKLPDPSTIGNAGSFFKNPIISNSQLNELKQSFPNIVKYSIDEQHSKVAAGWLIEQAGWKGKEIGNVAIWKNQALVITNKGNATGKEIFQVSQEIIDSVFDIFGIELEREVNIL
ncbi:MULTISPECIES: UDP-N-acetylmuramate dehydrogenase [Sphingobacterium]|uniref:UDP-N-acetylenolpyruvoylglucosamine reductase n=1 Tax=Sphingobacterium litopenaei TaxID=2763500 RepID=A0ABR7YE59_9SPHI|nr:MULTISPECIES: UDP-N-acetylmuramate dehydrogenase [Sphingobacterium]MBD1429595.1 UDP-N-acetylmuramate dehydrogenase [Sphingobacterium litopenaei]NGM73001.1 UDP-N-acetylmuramate dehydrogenase [Sphingobacterium sp. SGL-16]